MKAKLSALLPCVVVLFVSSCASYPGTGSLWIGMSREQALRAMGPPESVSAQGGFEYLNYTLRVSGGGVSRPYAIRLVDSAVESFGYSGQFSAGSSAPPRATRVASPGAIAADSIRVVATEPMKLALGVTTKVKVRIAYSLQGRPEAMISLSFNTKTPGMFLSLTKQNVPTGRGEVVIEVDVTPVDWVGRSDVKMMASLFPIPADGASSLAHTTWDLPVAR